MALYFLARCCATCRVLAEGETPCDIECLCENPLACNFMQEGDCYFCPEPGQTCCTSSSCLTIVCEGVQAYCSCPTTPCCGVGEVLDVVGGCVCIPEPQPFCEFPGPGETDGCGGGDYDDPFCCVPI